MVTGAGAEEVTLPALLLAPPPQQAGRRISAARARKTGAKSVFARGGGGTDGLNADYIRLRRRRIRHLVREFHEDVLLISMKVAPV